MKNTFGLQGARYFLYAQLAFTLCSMVCCGFWGVRCVVSAFLGGLVSALPHAFFAHRFFVDQRVAFAKQIVGRFYQGEALKIILSSVLFSLVFLVFNVVPVVFFTVYIGAQMMIWFAPMLFRRAKIY